MMQKQNGSENLAKKMTRNDHLIVIVYKQWH